MHQCVEHRLTEGIAVDGRDREAPEAYRELALGGEGRELAVEVVDCGEQRRALDAVDQHLGAAEDLEGHLVLRYEPAQRALGA